MSTNQPLASPPIASCYLDTSLTTTAIFTTIEHHQAAAGFCQQLFAFNATIYFSELLRLEYAEFFRRLQERVDAATRSHFRLQRWDLPHVRARWLEHGFRRFEQFINQFAAAREVALTRAIIDDAHRLMATHNSTPMMPPTSPPP
jgi:hypothetical protein